MRSLVLAAVALTLAACSPDPDPPTPGGPPQRDMNTPVDMRAEDMTVAPDLGVDMRQPNATTPPVDMNTSVDMPDEGMGVDMGCVPMCSGRVCGDDGCGGVCGECGALEVCGDAGACEEAPNQLTITLNDEVVYQTTEVQLQYTAGQNSLLAAWPKFGGHPFHITLPADTATPSQETCASAPETVATSLTLFAINIFEDGSPWGASSASTPCGTEPDGDVVSGWESSFDEISPTMLRGTFTMTVEGAGPRAGDTMRAFGKIDAVTQ